MEQLFRQYRADIFSNLLSFLGPSHWELAEDATQEAFSRALANWSKEPQNPKAWLLLTAKNVARDVLRHQKTQQKVEHLLKEPEASPYSENSGRDDRLTLLLMICEKDQNPDQLIPLVLKTTCGFSNEAIARGLVVPESAVKKRLFRARDHLKDVPFRRPSAAKVAEILVHVHTVIYLMFNEGLRQLKSKTEGIDLCREALELQAFVCDQLKEADSESWSLQALLLLNWGRLHARSGKAGGVPLNRQDRNLWDQTAFQKAELCLRRAKSKHDAPGRYFLEAMIANEHCSANTFEQTNWPKIAGFYQILLQIAPSPTILLNLALALAYCKDWETAGKILDECCQDSKLKKTFLPWATLAHVQALKGEHDLAISTADIAKSKGGNNEEHQAMFEQLAFLKNP